MNQLTNWDPFRELDAMHERINRLFDDSMRSSRILNSSVGSTDIYEEDGNVVVETSLPRFKKDEVELDIHDGRLEIKAQHKDEQSDEDKKRNYIRRESSYQSYYRQIALPKGADLDHAKADMHDGVLKITVPMKELPKPKKLQISGGDKK